MVSEKNPSTDKTMGPPSVDTSSHPGVLCHVFVEWLLTGQ